MPQNVCARLGLAALATSIFASACFNADYNWTSASSNGSNYYISLESAAGGSGTPLSALTFTSTSTPVTVYAVERALDGSYYADAAVIWSTSSGVGQTPVGAHPSISFLPFETGSGLLVAHDPITNAGGSLGYALTIPAYASIGAFLKSNGWDQNGSFDLGYGDGEFVWPRDVAFDPQGYIYVADSNIARVQRFRANTGEFAGEIGSVSVTGGTCASLGPSAGWCGGGQIGSGDHDGEFYSVAGMAVDSALGYLYVVDATNYRVTRFDATTGLAQGSIGLVGATTGTVNCPAAFTATSGWCTGAIYTAGALGEGDATFYSPWGIAVGDDHSIFVADAAMIKKFDPTGAFVGAVGLFATNPFGCQTFAAGAAATWCAGASFIASGGDGEIGSPLGLAYAAGSLYVVDHANYKVSRFNAATGAYGGSIGAVSTNPGACSLSASNVATGWCTGDIYTSSIADGGLKDPWGIAADAAGHLYVTDNTQGRIQRFDAASGAFEGAYGYFASSTGTCPATAMSQSWCTGGTSAGYVEPMGNPRGIAAGNDGALYVGSDYTRHAERLFAQNGGTSDLVGWGGAVGAEILRTATWAFGFKPESGTGNNGAFGQVTAAKVSSDALLYVVDQNGDQVLRFDAATGTYLGSTGEVGGTGGTCTSLGGANGWCVGGYFSGNNNDGSLNSPSSEAIDSTYLYVTDTGNSRVNRYVRSTGVYAGSLGYSSGNAGGGATCPAPPGFTGFWCTGGMMTYNASDGSLNTPVGIAVDASGDLYVADQGLFRINRYSSAGAYLGSIGYLSSSTGTCPATGAAGAWCTGGTFTNSPSDGAFQQPEGLAVDPSGAYLLVADLNRIEKFSIATGAFVGSIGDVGSTGGTCAAGGAGNGFCTGGTFVTGSLNGGFNSPNGLAFDPAGNLIVADSGNARLERFDTGTGAFTGWRGMIGTAPTGGDPGCSGASGVTPGWCTGGAAVSGSIDGAMLYPSDVSIDASGVYYVSDTNNYRVERFSH